MNLRIQSDVFSNAVFYRSKNKRLAIVFENQADTKFQGNFILPWVGYERIDCCNFDFVLYAFFHRRRIENLRDPNREFLISVESVMRYDQEIIQFVQNPRPTDTKWHRYSPPFVIWSAPCSNEQNFGLSAIDSGIHKNRFLTTLQVIKTNQHIPLKTGGKAFGSPIPGYFEHPFQKGSFVNQAAFHVSIENEQGGYYLTEKIFDAYMCEAVPIYIGAPNVGDYFKTVWNPNDKIPKDWKEEYAKLKDGVLADKEWIRTKLNIFSFFDSITDDMPDKEYLPKRND